MHPVLYCALIKLPIKRFSHVCYTPPCFQGVLPLGYLSKSQLTIVSRCQNRLSGILLVAWRPKHDNTVMPVNRSTLNSIQHFSHNSLGPPYYKMYVCILIQPNVYSYSPMYKPYLAPRLSST